MARGFSSPHFLFTCLKDYPFKLRQNVQSDSAVSIMRVPGRVDRYIGTTTSCNKGIGLVLRPLHMLACGVLGTGTDYGYVTIPRFAVLNARSISAAPTKWTREVSPSRAKRIVSMYAKHLTGCNEGAAHDDIAQCLLKGLPIDLYKTNRKVRLTYTSSAHDTSSTHACVVYGVARPGVKCFIQLTPYDSCPSPLPSLIHFTSGVWFVPPTFPTVGCC
jgi:hypothetical protein